MKKSFCTFLISLFLFTQGYSQIEFSGGVETSILDGTGKQLPFWMQHNQRGRIDAQTNFMSLLGGTAIHRWGEASVLEGGVNLLYQDAKDQLELDQIYLEYRNSWLRFIVGAKQEEQHYMGLSATNENLLNSINARPAPGLRWNTVRPLFILPKYGIGFEAGWEDYFLEEDRFVRNARLHHKYLRLVFRPSNDFELKAGMQHYVQWAGISQSLGHQP